MLADGQLFLSAFAPWREVHISTTIAIESFNCICDHLRHLRTNYPNLYPAFEYIRTPMLSGGE